MRFLDSNVLLYSISSDPAEQRKRSTAIAILRSADVAVSVQVMQEFYVQATRPTRTGRLTHAQAVQLVESWTRFPVQENTLPLLLAALDITARYGFSYWDSSIIAAAGALGCEELLTEDLSHGRVIEGVTIVNPFR